MTQPASLFKLMVHAIAKCTVYLQIKFSDTLPPSDVTAVQASPTDISVSWKTSSNATGYIIEYTSCRGHNRCVFLNGGSTDDYLMTNLQKKDIYSISIAATSDGFPSESVKVARINLKNKGKYL